MEHCNWNAGTSAYQNFLWLWAIKQHHNYHNYFQFNYKGKHKHLELKCIGYSVCECSKVKLQKQARKHSIWNWNENWNWPKTIYDQNDQIVCFGLMISQTLWHNPDIESSYLASPDCIIRELIETTIHGSCKHLSLLAWVLSQINKWERCIHFSLKVALVVNLWDSICNFLWSLFCSSQPLIQIREKCHKLWWIILTRLRDVSP